MDSSGDGSRLLVSWDEFDVLNATTIGNSDGVGDSTVRKPPEAKSIGSLNTKSRLENGDRNDKVRGKDQIVLKIDGETVGRELLAENVQGAFDVFRPLVDDVVVLVGLDQATRGCTNRGALVGNKESSIRFGTDLVSDRGEKRAVTLLELGIVWVGHVEVVSGVLSLQKRQETTTPDGFAIQRDTYRVLSTRNLCVWARIESRVDCKRTKMVRAVTRRRDIDYPEQCTEGIVIQTVRSQEVFVLVVTCTGPEVSDLLWFDLASLPWWRLQRWSGNLKDRKRRRVRGQRLCDARNGWDKWRKRQLRFRVRCS